MQKILANRKDKKIILYHEKIKKIVITITFHYAEKKLKNLSKITNDFLLFSKKVNVFIVTNTNKKKDHRNIYKSLNRKLNIKIIVPSFLGHPYLLTWFHLDIFRKEFFSDKNISHFMYLEDDIKISKQNIFHWQENRTILRKFGLIPSFLRYEIKNNNRKEKYVVDVTKRLSLRNLPKVKISDEYCYVNLPQPYQGMYLLDRDLMKEHLNGPSSSPDFHKCNWPIRESAAQGLTFANVPKKFWSRNVVLYNIKNKCVAEHSLIHHLSNNYIKSNTPFAKIKLSDLIKKSFF